MRLTALALLLATASCARQKYKGAPPEALHTAILHGGGVEGRAALWAGRSLWRRRAARRMGRLLRRRPLRRQRKIWGLGKQRLCRHEAAAVRRQRHGVCDLPAVWLVWAPLQEELAPRARPGVAPLRGRAAPQIFTLDYFNHAGSPTPVAHANARRVARRLTLTTVHTERTAAIATQPTHRRKLVPVW